MPCELLRKINEEIYTVYQTHQENIPAFTLDKNVKKVYLDKQAYYDTHTLMLADKNSPLDYRISELFKESSIPLNKSTSFTSPKIICPKISLTKNTATITFDKHFPKYYVYRIERSDYITHTTLYEGEYIPEFHDDTLKENKNYVYTVTPIYNGKEGTPVTLPAISTFPGEQPEVNHEILSKDWWDY